MPLYRTAGESGIPQGRTCVCALAVGGHPGLTTAAYPGLPPRRAPFYGFTMVEICL